MTTAALEGVAVGSGHGVGAVRPQDDYGKAFVGLVSDEQGLHWTAGPFWQHLTAQRHGDGISVHAPDYLAGADALAARAAPGHGSAHRQPEAASATEWLRSWRYDLRTARQLGRELHAETVASLRECVRPRRRAGQHADYAAGRSAA